MTLQEAYDKAKELGSKVYVSEHINTYQDRDESFRGYTMHVDNASVSSYDSFENCLRQVREIDPNLLRKDRIAKLKAEIEELES